MIGPRPNRYLCERFWGFEPYLNARDLLCLHGGSRPRSLYQLGCGRAVCFLVSLSSSTVESLRWLALYVRGSSDVGGLSGVVFVAVGLVHIRCVLFHLGNVGVIKTRGRRTGSWTFVRSQNTHSAGAIIRRIQAVSTREARSIES